MSKRRVPPPPDGGLWGVKPEEPEPEKRRWTEGQDIALSLAISCSESQMAYDQACTRLLDLVGHESTLSVSARPSSRESFDRNLRALENRYVTWRIRNIDKLPFWTLPPFRKGLPLTWGERVRILQPWLRKGMSGKERIEQPDLYKLMFRDAARDARRVQDYSSLVVSGKKFREAQDYTAGCPVTVRNMGPLQQLMRGYDNLGERATDAHRAESVKEMWHLMQAEVRRGWA